MTTIIDNQNKLNITKSMKPIYRFPFSQEFIEILYSFSKIHQYDDRKKFKEAWKEYLEDNDEIFANEINRLEQLGFTGDIPDKMFKSARYYFRKKTIDKNKDKKARQAYTCVSKELLASIDNHIKSELLKELQMKPSIYYTNYYQANKEFIENEIRLLNNDNYDIERNKIKKTYKNRYYLLTTNK